MLSLTRVEHEALVQLLKERESEIAEHDAKGDAGRPLALLFLRVFGRRAKKGGTA